MQNREYFLWICSTYINHFTLFVHILDSQTYSRAVSAEDGPVGEQEENEAMWTVGEETLADERLQLGLAETQCQNKYNTRQTKRKKPQRGRKSVRIGRWKVKRDDTAIE